MTQPRRPQMGSLQARQLAQEHYRSAVTARELPAYDDRNFLLEGSSGERSILKISTASSRPIIEMQIRALLHLQRQPTPFQLPRVHTTPAGSSLVEILDEADTPCTLRRLSFVDGRPMAELGQYTAEFLFAFGQALGQLDQALASFVDPAARHEFEWDLRQADRAGAYVAALPSGEDRALVEFFLMQFRAHATPRLADLRQSVIHGDANTHNTLVDEGGVLAGFIDFGDLIETSLVCEPAIAAAYAMLHQPEPLTTASHLIAGYNSVMPLLDEEIALLFPLLCARLSVSVILGARTHQAEPDNAHVGVTTEASWTLLRQLRSISPRQAEEAFRNACGKAPNRLNGAPPVTTTERILASRRRHLSSAQSVAYQRPLHMVRGRGQFLFDSQGRGYLDGVNNVCHVGHCHPRVVEAAHRQMGRLNTNTRYLYDSLAHYSERLTALLPDPLSVCFLVCSGSEANDLALRLARAHTGGHDVVVLDGAYHGHTTALIELSPYKFAGQGGTGKAPHVHVAAMPDPYRGEYKSNDANAGELYAASVGAAVEQAVARQPEQGGLAAFFAESLLGCGGQIEPPPGYLQAAFAKVRAAGGLCIADEVQIGFGRVGTHFWAFETQGVVPDIVTLGKPIGNGHPLAAVVTTPEIAASFANGMEYFNTFGGNPVSCEVGMAVLDVIEEDALQSHAARLGDRLLAEVRTLADRHPLLGDVRGRGLFLGFELVRDRTSLEPAAQEASRVVELLKEAGVLLSTDGPLYNVLKFKPPMVFDDRDADFLVHCLDRALAAVSPSSRPAIP